MCVCNFVQTLSIFCYCASFLTMTDGGRKNFVVNERHQLNNGVGIVSGKRRRRRWRQGGGRVAWGDRRIRLATLIVEHFVHAQCTKLYRY